jgi:hypothetical protein
MKRENYSENMGTTSSVNKARTPREVKSTQRDEKEELHNKN